VWRIWDAWSRRRTQSGNLTNQLHRLNFHSDHSPVTALQTFSSLSLLLLSRARNHASCKVCTACETLRVALQDGTLTENLTKRKAAHSFRTAFHCAGSNSTEFLKRFTWLSYSRQTYSGQRIRLSLGILSTAWGIVSRTLTTQMTARSQAGVQSKCVLCSPNVTRKPCCRKETARCRSCSFRFKVRRQHSLQV